ncbi:histidinol-phosphate aminotransferase family protein [bacterium]|nr:histidinol-phosphate aminotransferase family protein [bacterium]
MEKKEMIRNDILQIGNFEVEAVSTKIKLDQNESPYRLPKKLRKKISSPLFNTISENRYPQPCDYFEKKSKIGEYLGISPENLAFTAGADQAILGLMMVTKKRVLMLSPTYPIYHNDAIILQRDTEYFKMDEGNAFSFTGLEKKKDFDLVCLVSPNPPAGNLIPLDIIRELCSNNSVVLLDEAYYEISNVSHIDLLKEFSNLVLIRTLSKACSLAGMRLGYMISADPVFPSTVEKVLFTPYNLSLMHYCLMDNFPEISAWGLEYGKRLRKTSEAFQKGLSELKVPYFPGYGNFILTGLDRTQHSSLLKVGIKTRLINISDKAYVRISIGTPVEMDKTLQAIKSLTE